MTVALSIDGEGGGGPVRFPSVLGDGCPIRALGHRDGCFYVLDAAGQVRARRQRDFGPLGLLELFLGDAKWLVEVCPVLGRNKPGGLPWDNPTAAGLIMQACRAEGFFDPVEDVRGPGVWAIEGGGLACHVGNAVLRIDYKGRRAVRSWSDAGVVIDGRVYPAAPPEPAIGAVAADEAAGRELVKALGAWRWQRPTLDARLAAGWVFASCLVGAVPYRPTLWLVGDLAVGKSGFLECVAAVHGSRAAIWEDITAAAIKSRAGRSAIAVMVDELELSDDNRRARSIIELAKATYKLGQGNYARAGADAHVGRLDAIFAFGAVEPPPIDPAEASRHCVLQLDPLPVDGGAGARDHAAKIEKLRRQSPELRARMLHRYCDFGGAFQAIKFAMARRALSGRVADTFAPLLAGWWILANDAALDAPGADRLVDQVYDDIAETVLENKRAHDLAWQWLLTRAIEHFKSDQRRTMGSLIAEAVTDTPGAVNDTLERYGVAVVDRDVGDGVGLRRWVFVAVDHAGLRDVFRDTKWAGGGWTPLLRRLQGAVPAPHQVRFAGARHRGTLIPVDLHISVGAGDETPASVSGGEIADLS